MGWHGTCRVVEGIAVSTGVLSRPSIDVDRVTGKKGAGETSPPPPAHNVERMFICNCAAQYGDGGKGSGTRGRARGREREGGGGDVALVRVCTCCSVIHQTEEEEEETEEMEVADEGEREGCLAGTTTAETAVGWRTTIVRSSMVHGGSKDDDGVAAARPIVQE